jgi:glutamyl-tRNA reductase
MIKDLRVYNYAPHVPAFDIAAGDFVLKTCQRNLKLTYAEDYQLGHEVQSYRGAEAYRYLLEIICGLKSELLGENEIVAQFKEAYSNYVLNEQGRCTSIMRTLERLFKDAKEIRSKFLYNIGQHSYCALTRKILLEKTQASPLDKKLLILGSGKLAQDLLKIMNKKFSVTLSARNEEVANQLAENFKMATLCFENKTKFHDYPLIINTIGTEQEFLKDNFFRTFLNCPHHYFVDLAEPSALKNKSLSTEAYINLPHLFEKGKDLIKDKDQKIQGALSHIEDLSSKRYRYFESLKQQSLNATSISCPHSYDEA